MKSREERKHELEQIALTREGLRQLVDLYMDLHISSPPPANAPWGGLLIEPILKKEYPAVARPQPPRNADTPK